MKKIINLFLVLVFVISSKVYAGEASANSIDFEAHVKSNGDMDVTETIYWDITGDLNGVYRDILYTPQDKYGASNIDIKDVYVNGSKFEYSSLELSNGTSGKYNVLDIMDGKRIKVFTPSANCQKNVVINYTVKDVILVYEDIAELHWNFIGDAWEGGIGSVNIDIFLPSEDNMLKAWGHGSLNGIVTIAGASHVNLKASNVNSEVTARLVMDKTMFVNVKKTYYENGLDNILIEEENYAKEANLQRMLAKIMLYALGVVVILSVLSYIVWYNKKKKEFEKTDFDGKYFRELPEDYGPEVMCEALGTTKQANIMSAMLMNMARLKVISITEIKDKKTDYEIKLLKTKEEIMQMQNIPESSKYFIFNMLLEDNQTCITLNEFKKAHKNAQEGYVLKYNELLKIISDTSVKLDLFKADVQSASKGAKFWSSLPILSSLLLLAVSFLAKFEDLTGYSIMLIMLNIFATSLVAATLQSKLLYTSKGINHKAKWLAFGKFLEDFSRLEDYPMQSLVLWEHYLVYAVALGKAKKVIEQLKIMYPQELSSNNLDTLENYAIIGMCTNDKAYSNFNNSMSNAFSTFSSSNGSGGGFSGGGGSGGGGGGGGGF